jgi:hypothetical protein
MTPLPVTCRRCGLQITVEFPNDGSPFLARVRSSAFLDSCETEARDGFPHEECPALAASILDARPQ